MAPRAARVDSGLQSVFRRRFQSIKSESGLSWSGFCRQHDIPERVIDGWLYDGRLPSAGSLVHLALRLDVSVDWLLGLAEERKPW